MFKGNVNLIETNVYDSLCYLSGDFRKYLKKEDEME